MIKELTGNLNKKAKIVILGLASLSIAIAVTGLFFGYQLLKSPVVVSSPGGVQPEITFEITTGLTLNQIANQLQAKGLIRNSKSFQIYARLKGLAAKFKVGEYSLNQAMTPDEIMSVLISGKSITRNITFAEGLSLFDIAEVFEKNNIGSKEEFFKLAYDRAFIKSLLNENLASLEGYLFPETYQVTKFEGTKSVLTQMVNRFLTVWHGEIEPYARQNILANNQQTQWSRNQIVTFASIVEKETGASFERPLVSSVFHNRLTKKMRLQTDPTVLYGIALRQGKMPNNITKNDLLTATSHNTYTNAGLPPTPIANPGREALLATLNPAKTNYLFFVSQNNGTHVFSENVQQHNKAVREFQMNTKARANKSWRDLNQSNK